jgi:hypothetical protein
MLSARALMETLAVMVTLERRVDRFLKEESLGALDELAQRGIFASRDKTFIENSPETEARNVLLYVDKLDKRVPGFRNHYDRLSERCHPNALGHNFMFAELDRSDGTVRFCDEREPVQNARIILAALAPLTLLRSTLAQLDTLIEAVSELQHRLAPVGSASEKHS